MREQLANKGTQTPGKIMHTKVFQQGDQNQIRCYFAYNNNEVQIDWHKFVSDALPESSLDDKFKFI